MVKHPAVSVIMRTKDRPVLLPRAVESVLSQTDPNWELLIVNDGGDPGPVDALVQSKAKNARRRISAIHNQRSLGMEAASNAGISRAQGKYLVIHDDDDSWSPEFLQETMGYMESQKDDNVGGVVTYSMRVSERISGNSITLIEKTPFNTWIAAISLHLLCCSNPFPPISFLYRRDCLKQVGTYREDLPVLGDWEFNLRFLRRYFIDLIPRPMANYHQRASLADDVYSNTIIAGMSLHQRYDARIRDELLRQDMESGTIGLGYLLNISKVMEGRIGPLANNTLANVQTSVLSALCARIRQDGNREVIVYGAGDIGRRFGDVAGVFGLKPLCYADRNPSLWGASIHGATVYPLDKAAELGNHVYAIASFAHPDEIRENIMECYRSRSVRPQVYHPLELAWSS